MYTGHPLPRAICGCTAQGAPAGLGVVPHLGPAPPHLLENGTSDVTVILLLLLSMVTTPPPRFPALPFTLIRSCRNCSCRRAQLLARATAPTRHSPHRMACTWCSGVGEETPVPPQPRRAGESPFLRPGKSTPLKPHLDETLRPQTGVVGMFPALQGNSQDSGVRRL